MEHARHPAGLFFLCVCDWILHGTQLLELISVPSGQCAYSPTALIPTLGRSPGEGNGSRPQYSCLENSMDRGAWRATVHGVGKSWTFLSYWAHKHLSYIQLRLRTFSEWEPFLGSILCFHGLEQYLLLSNGCCCRDSLLAPEKAGKSVPKLPELVQKLAKGKDTED